VTFDQPDGAAAAIQNRPHVIDGDIVDVEIYIPMPSKKRFKTM
jgi:hypothetical protein